MDKETNTYDFFDLVLSGEYGNLDIDNYIQKKTDNYNIDKLKLFLYDIEYCLFVEKDELVASFTQKDIKIAKLEFTKNNLEIPVTKRNEAKNKEGKVIFKACEFLDLEKLLFPYEFFCIYQLIGKLNKYINDALIITTTQQTETKPGQLTPTFENEFDQVKPAEIYNHFKAGLVDKGHLSEQDLVKYLKAAFELETIPETLFKIKDTLTKQKISSVFYKYFKNIAGTPHGRQKQYAALLGDYFEGYDTKNVSSNFNK
jgi:hypothetical protein